MTVYKIYTPQDLADMANDPAGEYHLMNDIDLSEWGQWWNIELNEGKFNGNGYCIKNLTITEPWYESATMGLFSKVLYSTVENVELLNMSADFPKYYSNASIGGIAGTIEHSKIINCKVSISCTMPDDLWMAGGIVAISSNNEFSRCEANVTLSCRDGAGGIAGEDYYSVFNECFAEGEIVGGYSCGGLVGAAGASEISNCYSRTSVSSDDNAGGLIGHGLGNTSLVNCYASGQVNGADAVGGFIGLDEISDAYGDFVIASNYYDRETTGMSDTKRATPKSTEEMMQKATFRGWDFNKIWRIVEGVTYPQFTNLKRTQCESMPMRRTLR